MQDCLYNMRHKTHSLFRALHVLVLAGLIPFAAHAAPKAVGKFKNWSVYTDTKDGETICYAATAATKKSPRSADHGDVWYYVTYWKTGSSPAQPSLKVGYDLKPERSPKTIVGRSSWTMFASGREGFAEDADDPRIIDAIRKGADLKVEAMSARGTSVSYTFSLSGSAAAIDEAEKTCK